MGKVDLNKQQKLDTLLESSFDLFTNIGLAETTISNIVEHAGVAKGTFYLYFKDKYDLHTKLVVYKARHIFSIAFEALKEAGITDTEESVIFIVNNILDQFEHDKKLLRFVSKNLSWGIFKNELIHPVFKSDNKLEEYRAKFFEHATEYDNPELLLYMVSEIVSSTCYSPILYNEPVSLAKIKPILFGMIRNLMQQHKIQK